jgi:hypothetical protein
MVDVFSFGFSSPVPRESIKSGCSKEGNLVIASDIAKARGSFSSGPASWKVPTSCMYFGEKKLKENH